MAEYIDLDTPLEVYAECGGVCKKQITSLRDLLDINKISYTAADVVERKKGKWKTAYLDHEAFGIRPRVWYCSECQLTASFRTFFCQNCGADMREEPADV